VEVKGKIKPEPVPAKVSLDEFGEKVRTFGTVGPGIEEKGTRTIRLSGTLPPEVWNQLGTKVLPKLRSGSELRIGIDFSVTFPTDFAGNMIAEIQQALDDLGLADKVKLD